MTNTFTLPVINKALAQKPWITRHGPNTYRVVPRTADHGKYELKVIWGDVPVVTECVDYRTGEECRGFRFDGQCYHSAALLIKLVKRTERRAA